MKVIDNIKWVSGVLLVFFIILATNLVDKQNFNSLRNSIVTIYEDRIVASDLIFEMGLLIQEKEMALASENSSFYQQENDGVNREIQQLIAQYEETKLTKEERTIFSNLKKDVSFLQQQEQSAGAFENETRQALFETINNIVQDLYDLSKVQLKEGRRVMKRSNRAMETVNLFTQIEIIILIVIAVLIQIIILYTPAKKRNA